MGKYIGTMWIEGTVESYDYDDGTDVFLIESDITNVDHIWPTARNGSNWKDNKQTITRDANNLKADNIAGYIRDVRFTTLTHAIDDFGKVIGTTYVSYDDGSNWYEVINVDS